MIAKNILVKGKVQGVFFRKYTQIKAKELGILGFVKNLPDGDVYIYAIGLTNNLNAFVEWCKTGSPFSKVLEVKVVEAELKVYEEFSIVH